jgi:periplasmic divalent cation tolerance protein
MDLSDLRVVISTAPDEGLAFHLARTLVEERIAACVNCIPGVRSLYRWEGRLCDDHEILLVMKTTAACLPRLLSRLKDLHPYAVPEVVALPVIAGSEPYLAWVRSETSGQ